MEKQWHTLPISFVEHELETSIHTGLSADEAKKRLEKYGPNELPEGRRDSYFSIFLRQFQSPLIYILLIASAIVFLTGKAADGLIIIFVLIFNAIIGAFQEGKAQATLAALKKFSEARALVLRGGEEMMIADKEVVPGDLIILQEGEKIPADARILEARVMHVDEAALTGESVPAHKEETILKNTSLKPADCLNMIFKGTNVVSGNGKGIVVATGPNTIIGRISQSVAALDTEIPLKKDIKKLTSILVTTVGAISIVFFCWGIFSGRPVFEVFSVVVALAVSIVPEGLPLVLTVVLATGVSRMAKRNALVKKLQAVEALGQAKIIAVDKTGTLTKNEIVIRDVFVDGKTFFVGGFGYEPNGDIKLGENVVDPANHPEILLAGKIAVFCTNAKTFFREEEKLWKVAGDPTEAAMSVFAEKVGFHKGDIERESPLVGELPFDYEKKYHLTVHLAGKKFFAAVVGAPEKIFDISEKIFAGEKSVILSKEKRRELTKIFHEMSGRGLRVVAFAFLEKPADGGEKNLPSGLKNFVFGGFYGMMDSLRPEVSEAVREAREAGMKLVMITGDHRLTALAVAKEAGIWRDGDKILTGDDLDALSEDALSQELPGVSVFARVTPEHKLKIISAYRKRGEVIAMTGDGVNDALPLVAADLGVAMGKIGTDVAKEASDIILLDDNFASIISAIEEGRNMFKTIQKSVLFLISTSIGEVLTIVGSVFVGLPLPLLPAQIIWLNLVTDPFMGAALALEPKEKNLLRREFRRPKTGVIDSLMLWRFLLISVTMTLGTFYIFGKYYEFDLVKAQTIALTALAAFQWFNAWNCRSEYKSVFGDLFSNKPLIGMTALVVFLQILAVYAPPLQSILHTAPLTLKEWLLIILVSLSILVVEEARKAHFSIKKKYEEFGD